MLENVYEGLNARPKVYFSKKYFCEMYPTCVSSKLCEFILLLIKLSICNTVFAKLTFVSFCPLFLHLSLSIFTILIRNIFTASSVSELNLK